MKLRTFVVAASIITLLLGSGTSLLAQVQGLRGEYFEYDPTLPGSPDRFEVFLPENLKVTRVDRTVDFNWGNGSYEPGQAVDKFAARWTGWVVAPEAGDYTFQVAGDDGVVLWVSDSDAVLDPDELDPFDALISGWVDQGETPYTADTPITLAAGERRYIVYEFYENGGGAVARLRWALGSGNQTIIPAENLVPAGVDPNATPPAAITDLAATPAAPDAVTLTWTAPVNGPARYEIRYALVPPTAANWSLTTLAATDGVTSTTLGERVTVKVAGLEPLQTYHFGVRVTDNTLLQSAVSNTVSVQTPSAAGDGLKGEYYEYDTSLGGSPDRFEVFLPENLKFTQVDPVIDFTTLPANGIREDKWAARWTGQISPPATDDYTFGIGGDDGIRLWISEAPIDVEDPGVDILGAGTFDASPSWIDQGDTAYTALEPIRLEQGKKYYVLFEFYENGGGQAAHLRWSTPTQAMVPVAQAYLYSGAAVSPMGRLNGTVSTPTGEPAPGVALEVVSSEGTIHRSQTDAFGSYSLLLPAGSYTVRGSGTTPLGVRAAGQVGPATVNADQVTAAPALALAYQPLPEFSVVVDKAVYYDEFYGTGWLSNEAGIEIRDFFVDQGYTLVDAEGLKTFMEAHVASQVPSAVILARDWAPDTVIDISNDVVTNKNLLTDYMAAGGRVIHYGDWPFYYIGRADGTNLNPAGSGGTTILGFNVAGGVGDQFDTVVVTEAGKAMGLTSTWASQRPILTADADIVTHSGRGGAAGWVRFWPDQNSKGFFARLVDTTMPSITPEQLADGKRLAEISGTITIPGTGPGAVKGDVDGNGQVAILDVVAALRIVAGLATATPGNLAGGDLNGNGRIEITEVVQILRAVAGLAPL